MDQNEIFLIIVAMGVVTFVPRALPVLILSVKVLPKTVIRWLGNIPVAVLAAMLFPSLLISNGSFNFSGNNLFLWVSIPTFIVAAKTKSLFATVISGMMMVAAYRFLLI
jgi:branched-subunit amino acid transport protein